MARGATLAAARPPGGRYAQRKARERAVRGAGVLAAARVGRRGRRYILGGENLELHELLARIGDAVGRPRRPPVLPAAVGPWLRAAMNLVEPLVPDGSWYTPDLCAAFGWWLFYDTRRMREELGVQPADLTDLSAPGGGCLPEYAIAALREALPAFDRLIKGFAMPDALLTGVETRTSSPLRITRGRDHQSLNVAGLYPAGEGAGYAGGIMSAGVDGIEVAEAVAASMLGVSRIPAQ